ncbi:transthyretin-like family protein [Anatilimnocola floriformis]|uniref:transthyretin-like family protein n=1 Tax=Anatilimnocola floriformis TaxID=2948575 RepID=UPI0020C4DAB4|nr:transthyretin-like family protein [Anatilimnocola floriformis]
MPAGYRFPLAGSLALLFVVALSAGCSKSDRVAVHPVEGQLSWNGQPLANAFVVLHPQDKSNPKLLAARAQTDAEGKFQLTTYDQADGAAAGEYQVTVEYFRPVNNGGSFVPGPNVLPAKLARPETSEITVSVAAGKNTLQPIVVR